MSPPTQLQKSPLSPRVHTEPYREATCNYKYLCISFWFQKMFLSLPIDVSQYLLFVVVLINSSLVLFRTTIFQLTVNAESITEFQFTRTMKKISY